MQGELKPWSPLQERCTGRVYHNRYTKTGLRCSPVEDQISSIQRTQAFDLQGSQEAQAEAEATLSSA